MSEHANSEHSHSLMPYIVVLAALLVLTVVTVGAALVDFGKPWSDLVALAIASFKAFLVVTFFMHVKGGTKLIKLTAASGFVWLFLFFLIVMTDYFTRAFVYTPIP